MLSINYQLDMLIHMRFFCEFRVNVYGEIIYINFNIYVHKTRYVFNKIVNLTKFLF